MIRVDDEFIEKLSEQIAERVVSKLRGAPAPSADEPYEPMSALAKRFGVTPQFLGRLARVGKLKAIRAGKHWRARHADVTAALAVTHDEPPPMDIRAKAAEMLAPTRRKRPPA